MKRREMKQLLEERFERIALLETRIDTMEQLVDGYHAREQSLIDTLHTAQNTAKKIVERAHAEADAAREQARRDGEALRSEARREAQATVEHAQQQAQEFLVSAKSESDRVLRDAAIIKSEYEELIASFNAMLEQNASELHETAARFAEFVRGRKIESPEVRLDGEAFYKSVGAMKDAQLPDPDGDPATLMKNIYLLQKRPIPDAEESAAEESGLQADATAAGPAEEQPREEPFSERAWESYRQQSPSEPQAEFTPAFDSAFEPSDAEVKTSECAVSAGGAEQAFDEYFSAPEFSDAQKGQTAESKPYSRAAWESSRQESESEPQAEAEKAFDDFFSGAYEPDGKAAQSEFSPERTERAAGATPEPYSEKAWAQGAFLSNQEPQSEGALAFDAMFASAESGQATGSASYEQVRAEEPPQPADTPAAFDAAFTEDSSVPGPYSEEAWAQGAFRSPNEPQAEGTSAFDAMFGESGAGEDAYHSFETEQEPREWEPEREPDADEVPTVSKFVPRGSEEEVSLDALLDEIIKAGE